MKHTTTLYNRKNRAWRLWSVWSRNELRNAYPKTDGNELFIHNWYVCGDDPKISVDAQAKIDRVWARWRELDDRYKRLYDIAEHREHVREGRHGDYLWCVPCQAA